MDGNAPGLLPADIATVELQYFDGCTNWQHVDGLLRRLASELGFDLVRRRVRDATDAEALRFRGSPTILVEGRDPFGDDDAPIGLSCRIYSTPSGPAGSPTMEQLRCALRG